MIRRINPDLAPLLQTRWSEFLDDAAYSRWYVLGSSISTRFVPEENDWNAIERVSVADGRVIGLLGARVDRDTQTITNLYVINFEPHGPGMFVFGRDLHAFLRRLLETFTAVRWYAVADSPNDARYRRWIELLGGRVVGRVSRYARLQDGTVHDGVLFEVIGRGEA